MFTREKYTPENLQSWQPLEWNAKSQLDGNSCGIFVLMVNMSFYIKYKFCVSLKVTLYSQKKFFKTIQYQLIKNDSMLNKEYISQI